MRSTERFEFRRRAWHRERRQAWSGLVQAVSLFLPRLGSRIVLFEGYWIRLVSGGLSIDNYNIQNFWIRNTEDCVKLFYLILGKFEGCALVCRPDVVISGSIHAFSCAFHCKLCHRVVDSMITDIWEKLYKYLKIRIQRSRLSHRVDHGRSMNPMPPRLQAGHWQVSEFPW
jgi:hypothetical protein